MNGPRQKSRKNNSGKSSKNSLKITPQFLPYLPETSWHISVLYTPHMWKQKSLLLYKNLPKQWPQSSISTPSLPIRRSSLSPRHLKALPLAPPRLHLNLSFPRLIPTPAAFLCPLYSLGHISIPLVQQLKSINLLPIDREVCRL